MQSDERSHRTLMKRFVPAKVIQSRTHRRTFIQFAERVGLVYFGYVDQRHDEHRLVRGLTVSAKHRDNHYCVGSFNDYDVSLVERTDTIQFPGKSPKAQDWIIMTFDLHRQVDLPHMFVGLHTHGEVFFAQLFTKFPTMTVLPISASEGYDARFLQRYGLYAHQTQVLSAMRLFSPTVALAIVENFHGLAIEVSEGCLYLYAEHQRPTAALLERMLRYGTWLAQSIDAESDS